MLVINLTTGATTTSDISVTEVLSTNNKAVVSTNNSVQLMVPGFYEIEGVATVTNSTTGDYGIAIYGNGELIGTQSIKTAPASTTETITLPLYATVEVTSITNENEYATITFLPIGAPTIVGSNISIKSIQ